MNNINKNLASLRKQSIAYAKDLAQLYKKDRKDSKTLTEKLDELDKHLPKVCPKCKNPWWNTRRKGDKRA